MINQLIAYARRKGIGTPGIAAVRIKYALNISREGEYLGVVELGDTDNKKNPGQEFSYCPQTPGMNSGGKAHFLVDSLGAVVGYGDEDGKQAARRAFFLAMLREAEEVLPEAGCFAALLADEACRARIIASLEERKAKPTDKVTLRVEGRAISFLLDDEAWRGWWSHKYAELNSGAGGKSKTAGQMRCFATGEMIDPAATHPKITTLTDVGASSMGALLVSFDKDALCSYGLSKSLNAAMSGEGAAMYAAAFNEIASRSGHRLAGTKVLCWYDRDIPAEDDPAGWLEDAGFSDQNEREALTRLRELFAAVREGKNPYLADTCYFMLNVCANAGRVMVREWREGSYAEFAQNTLEWFEDLAVTARDGKALAKPPKFLAVVGSLLRDLKDAPAPLVDALWRAAVSGRRGRIPRTALAKAVERFRIDAIADEPANHARMGLIKAYHIRKGDTNMSTGLNENYPHPAYHCGRLMAVLADLQYAALGDVGAGVVQRYYAAASTTPALVLGRLIRNSRFHFEKAQREKKGWAIALEKQLTQIWQQITPDNLPKALGLDEQSLFAMGYYHQKAYRSPAPDTDPAAPAGQ